MFVNTFGSNHIYFYSAYFSFYLFKNDILSLAFSIAYFVYSIYLFCFYLFKKSYPLALYVLYCFSILFACFLFTYYIKITL